VSKENARESLNSRFLMVKSLGRNRVISAVRREGVSHVKLKILATVALALVALGLAFLVRSARDAAREMSCRNTFKSIGIALLNYSDSYKTLPPAVTLDSEGKLKHSWRPLILNYVVAMPPVYEMDDAWDGPRNVRLINGHRFHFGKPPENMKDSGPYDGPLDFSQWFRCKAHESTREYSANVVAVVGKETLWPGTSARDLSSIPDGASNTILLAETRDPDIYWSQPKDLVFDDMSFAINSPARPSISSHHASGPLIVMADCSTYRISPQTPADIVRSLLTYDGDESYAVDQLVDDGFLVPDR
jgi:hypothetical protein